MNAYIVEPAPNGKFFVSKWGWGRRFDDRPSAQSYAQYMNELEGLTDAVSDATVYEVQAFAT